LSSSTRPSVPLPWLLILCAWIASPFVLMSCSGDDSSEEASGSAPGQISQNCEAVESGSGEAGSVPIVAEPWVTGLEVPWGLAFLPSGNALVTERPGRIRHVSAAGSLASSNVATVETSETGEGGLLGLAIDPAFAANRNFYVYYTGSKEGRSVNRVQRFTLSGDEKSAVPGAVILDDVAAASFHDGGALKFGPDGKLYVGVGDAGSPASAQDPAARTGKILRINSDGSVPGDNPAPGQAGFVLGVRNTQGFDWLDPSTLVVTDHGPTGEVNGWTGADEISFARAGDNLGWPRIHRCDTEAGLRAPAITWFDALPPGGALIYRGDAIPEWKGDLIVGVLGFGDGPHQLQRVILAKDGSAAVLGHEAYLRGERGRLRNVVQGPDGLIYVTTSNCDSRGSCPAERDLILRIRRG
jgi:glucose/arabinose dehydrogenase